MMIEAYKMEWVKKEIDRIQEEEASLITKLNATKEKDRHVIVMLLGDLSNNRKTMQEFQKTITKRSGLLDKRIREEILAKNK